MDNSINVLTREWVHAYCANPTAAVLIDGQGDNETGKELCQYIHRSLIQDQKSPLLVVEPVKAKSIGIDDIRELQKTLSLKANKSDTISRMAAVYKADSLTTEAQNALLKLIEELPSSTVVCLVTKQADSLLQTIRSRCFTIPLLPFDSTQASKDALQQGIDAELLQRSLAISNGNYGQYNAMLQNGEAADIQTAKRFLTASVYERQIMLQQLQKSKEYQPSNLIEALITISRAAMRNAQDTQHKHVWKQRLQAALDSQQMLQSNVMTKLVMLRLSIQL